MLLALEERSWDFGGEQSGHLIFRNLSPTGDGLLTGLLLCDLVARRGPLNELAEAAWRRVPQELINVAHDHYDDAAVRALFDAVVAEYGVDESDVRLLIRPSGTEPVMRVMVEALDARVRRRSSPRACGATHVGVVSPGRLRASRVGWVHVRHHRGRRLRRRSGDPARGPRAPGVPRLRLGRRGPGARRARPGGRAPRRAPSRSPRCAPSAARLRAASSRASATRAGRPTAPPRSSTPTPTWTARATSRSSTTASSRTTPSSRSELESRGHRFTSVTDSEVLAHLIEEGRARGPRAARRGARRACSSCAAPSPWPRWTPPSPTSSSPRAGSPRWSWAPLRA